MPIIFIQLVIMVAMLVVEDIMLLAYVQQTPLAQQNILQAQVGVALVEIGKVSLVG